MYIMLYILVCALHAFILSFDLGGRGCGYSWMWQYTLKKKKLFKVHNFSKCFVTGVCSITCFMTYIFIGYISDQKKNRSWFHGRNDNSFSFFLRLQYSYRQLPPAYSLADQLLRQNHQNGSPRCWQGLQIWQHEGKGRKYILVMGRVNNIWFLFCLGILTAIVICQDDVKVWLFFYAPKNYYFLKELKTQLTNHVCE